MKKTAKGGPIFRLPRRAAGPRPVSSDTRTYLLLEYMRARRTAGPPSFADLQTLLRPLAPNDRLFFFVNRLPVVLHVVCHPSTGAKALRYGARIFGSSEEVAWNLRLDVRCGVSLRHERALLDWNE